MQVYVVRHCQSQGNACKCVCKHKCEWDLWDLWTNNVKLYIAACMFWMCHYVPICSWGGGIWLSMHCHCCTLTNLSLIWLHYLICFKRQKLQTANNNFLLLQVEKLYDTWYQSGSFSLIIVGSGFHYLHKFPFFFFLHAGGWSSNWSCLPCSRAFWSAQTSLLRAPSVCLCDLESRGINFSTSSIIPLFKQLSRSPACTIHHADNQHKGKRLLCYVCNQHKQQPQ